MSSKPPMFFRVYPVFLSCLLGFIFWMSLKQTYTWVEWLDLPMTLIALAGVWGYGFAPGRFSGWFWHAVLGGILVWDLVFNFFLRSFAHWGVHTQVAVYEMLAVGFVLFLPEYIALYRYGYTRREKFAELGYRDRAA